jgi:hypothetical protein
VDNDNIIIIIIIIIMRNTLLAQPIGKCPLIRNFPVSVCHVALLYPPTVMQLFTFHLHQAKTPTRQLI